MDCRWAARPSNPTRSRIRAVTSSTFRMAAPSMFPGRSPGLSPTAHPFPLAGAAPPDGALVDPARRWLPFGIPGGAPPASPSGPCRAVREPDWAGPPCPPVGRRAARRSGGPDQQPRRASLRSEGRERPRQAVARLPRSADAVAAAGRTRPLAAVERDGSRHVRYLRLHHRGRHPVGPASEVGMHFVSLVSRAPIPFGRVTRIAERL